MNWNHNFSFSVRVHQNKYYRFLHASNGKKIVRIVNLSSCFAIRQKSEETEIKDSASFVNNMLTQNNTCRNMGNNNYKNVTKTKITPWWLRACVRLCQCMLSKHKN